MVQIIVGLDGSEGSRAALRWAARTAAAQGAGLRAVAAWQYPASAVIPAGPAQLIGPEEMDERTCDEVRSVVREELQAGADRVEVEAGRGPAAPVLLGVATRTGADMLVLGARGLGGFAGLLLGSVSQECVEHSPCPVVVFARRTRPVGWTHRHRARRLGGCIPCAGLGDRSRRGDQLGHRRRPRARRWSEQRHSGGGSTGTRAVVCSDQAPRGDTRDAYRVGRRAHRSRACS